MIQPARIHVRFSDLDILGHVNNAIYLSYFEIARVHYFGQLLGIDWDWKHYTVVLVKNEVQYFKPVLLHDEVYVHMSVTHIGEKSFTLGYELKVNGEIRTTGSSTLVAWDAEGHQTMLIHPEMKNALEHLKSEQ
ncbi:MAG: acyl-CoA thioesterase [Bacteroidetes bacterium]|nr:MAG: acyl-CoA thioesterase [Bacteroidota bacterium]